MVRRGRAAHLAGDAEPLHRHFPRHQRVERLPRYLRRLHSHAPDRARGSFSAALCPPTSINSRPRFQYGSWWTCVRSLHSRRPKPYAYTARMRLFQASHAHHLEQPLYLPRCPKWLSPRLHGNLIHLKQYAEAALQEGQPTAVLPAPWRGSQYAPGGGPSCAWSPLCPDHAAPPQLQTCSGSRARSAPAGGAPSLE